MREEKKILQQEMSASACACICVGLTATSYTCSEVVDSITPDAELYRSEVRRCCAGLEREAHKFTSTITTLASGKEKVGFLYDFCAALYSKVEKDVASLERAVAAVMEREGVEGSGIKAKIITATVLSNLAARCADDTAEKFSGRPVAWMKPAGVIRWLDRLKRLVVDGIEDGDDRVVDLDGDAVCHMVLRRIVNKLCNAKIIASSLRHATEVGNRE